MDEQVRVYRQYNLQSVVSGEPSDYPAMASLAIEQWLQRLAADGGQPTPTLSVTFTRSNDGGHLVVRVTGAAVISEALAEQLDAQVEA